MSDALTRLVCTLGSAPLCSKVDARTLADALWLAASGSVGRGPAPPRPESAEETAARPDPPALPGQAGPELAGDGSPIGARSRELFVRSSGAGEMVRGAPLSLGRANPLPDALAVGRAVQPFRRPWRRGGRSLLDIDATVEHYARGGPLVPLFRPAPELWFESVVVVDASLSMSVWEETVRAITRLLTTLGGFRAVHTWRLEWQGDEPLVRDHHGREVPRERIPFHGSGTGGRRLVLLFSDCAARGWRSPVPWLLLRDWGAQVPVALLDPLPPRLWRRSALTLPPVRVTAARAGEPNGALRFRLPPRLRAHGDAEDLLGPWSALPVVSCSPNSLGAWASTLMRADPRGCDAVLIPATGRLPRTRRGPAPVRQTDPTQLAEAFLRTAPTPAVRLAVLCSEFTELPLPLLHMLRDEAVPEARYSDLAELLTSGLFTVRRDADGDPLLALSAPARAHLRTYLTAHDAWHMRAALSRHAAAHPYAPGGLAAILYDPTAAREVPAQPEPFAETATVAPAVGDAAATGLPGAARPASAPGGGAAATVREADAASAVYEGVQAEMRPLFGPSVARSASRDTERLLRRLIDYTCHRLPAPLGDWPHRNTIFDDLRPLRGSLTLTHVINDLQDQLSSEGIHLEGPEPDDDAREQDLLWPAPGAPLRVTVRMETDFSWLRVMQAVRSSSPRTAVALSPVEFLLVLDDSDKPGGLQPLGSCVALMERTAPQPAAVVVFRVQTRLGKERRESRDTLARALRELHRRAGAPTYRSLVLWARQMSPAVHLSTSTLSDWFNGKAVPADEHSYVWLVRFLAAQEGRHADPEVTVARFTELRRRALQRPLDAGNAPASSARFVQRNTGLADRVVQEVPHYVERDHDPLLHAVVRHCVAGTSKLVLLVGPPGSGKSQSAREAVRHLPADWSVWEPRSNAELDKKLGTPAGIGGRTVVWLGDVEYHLMDETAGGRGERIAAALRARLRDPADGPVLVLGTVGTEYWTTLTSGAPPFSSDRRRQARTLCLTGVAIPVSARQAASRPSYLTSGADAIERYSSALPFIRAFVDAAVDVRRCGHGPVIPGDLLADAALGYLRRLEENTPDLSQLSVGALHRAGLIQVAPGESASRLGMFRLTDDIEQYGRDIRFHATPPPTLWDALARNAAVEELEAIAHLAQERRDSQTAKRFRALALERRVTSRSAAESDAAHMRGLLERTDLSAEEVIAVTDQALAWLSTQQHTGSAHLILTALLSRADMPRRQTAEAIRQALDWLATRRDTTSARTVLPALLLRGDLSQEQAHAVVDHAQRWLNRFGGTRDSRLLYSAALHRDDLLPDARRRIVRYALDWLASAVASFEAQYVLYSLLQRDDLTPEEAYETEALALAWLEYDGHNTELEARVVLSALLSRNDLTAADTTRACDRALEWLRLHRDTPSAHSVLRPLLLRSDLAGEAVRFAVEEGLRLTDVRNTANEPHEGAGELTGTRTAAMDSEREHLVVVVDIADFAKKSVTAQMNARSTLDGVLVQMLPQGKDKDAPSWERNDRGDGQIIVFEAGTRAMALAPNLLARLERALHDLEPDTSLRLRLALHCGAAVQHRGTWVGRPVDTACRLVDSRPLRATLNAASDSPAAVAVSDTLFRAVFSERQGPRDLFRLVYIRSKEVVEKAWISVAGYPEPPAVEAWSRPPEVE